MPRPSEPAGAAAGEGGDAGPGAGEGARGRGGRCPICGKPTQPASRPFCSKRCRDVDLNRWLSGAYVVPGSEAEDEGSE